MDRTSSFSRNDILLFKSGVWKTEWPCVALDSTREDGNTPVWIWVDWEDDKTGSFAVADKASLTKIGSLLDFGIDWDGRM